MTATLIPAATETEWLEARRHGVTASEIASVMGLAPDSWASPFALYHRKRGDLPDVEDSMSLRVGRHLESLVCDLFSEQHDEFELIGDGRMLYAHSNRPWQMATPDRVVCDVRFDFDDAVGAVEDYEPYAVLEAKTSASYDGWGEDGTDEIPVHYRCQVLWQMDVMGVTTAFVACLFTHSRRLRVYEITLDADAEADLKLMREEAETFLSRITRGNEPEVDWRPATTDALKTLNPGVEQVDITIRPQLARSYRAAIKRHKDAEQRKELMTNRMLQAIGTGRRAIDPAGKTVATRSVYPVRRIATSALRKDYPDAAAACTVTRDVIKLLPAKPEKDTE